MSARIEMDDETIRVVFHEPHIAAPGQFLVLYRGDECLGGGTISHDARVDSHHES